MTPRPARLVLPFALLAAALAPAAVGQKPDPSSPWYLERGTAPRAAAPEDEVPSVAAPLAALMKDGGVPGFYDGQFKSVADRFDELATLASDPDAHHVLRIMAVMALQEAGHGEQLAGVLDPLIMPAEQEYSIMDTGYFNTRDADEPKTVREQLDANLSEHARFALAKDGQTEAVMAKIEVIDQHIRGSMMSLLDPALSSDKDMHVRVGRDLIFLIGYHYQQFDDYAHASEWYHKLTDNLPGSSDTTWAYYNLACIAALTGHPDEAIAQLREAYKVGFTDSSWMAQDGDLKSLRDRPDFKALLASMRNEPEAAPARRPGSIQGSDHRSPAPEPTAVPPAAAPRQP